MVMVSDDGRVLVSPDETPLGESLSKLRDGSWVEGIEFSPYDIFHNFGRATGAEHDRLLAEAKAAAGGDNG